MDVPHLHIRDVRLINDGAQQSVAVEFGDGRVRTFSAQDLHNASRFLGQAPSDSQTKTAAQRRAEELLSAKRGRR